MANSCFQLNFDPNTLIEFVYTLGLKFIYEVQREGNNCLSEHSAECRGDLQHVTLNWPASSRAIYPRIIGKSCHSLSNVG